MLSALVLLCNILPLVIEFFSSGKADFQLGSSVFKVNLQRNDGVTLFGNFSVQFADFHFVQQ